jgi:hypothetical protein
LTVLAVAVVFVAVLCVLDLLLTLGVIRRLREHTSRLENLEVAGYTANSLPVVGEKVGEFTATTVDGTSLSRDSLMRETLVGFFSPTCVSCKEKLPDFVDHARRWVNDRRQVLAVVTGPVELAGEMVESLRPLGITVVDGVRGPVSSAFKADYTPMFCLLDDTGTVIGADYDFTTVPALAHA